MSVLLLVKEKKSKFCELDNMRKYFSWAFQSVYICGHGHGKLSHTFRFLICSGWLFLMSINGTLCYSSHDHRVCSKYFLTRNLKINLKRNVVKRSRHITQAVMNKAFVFQVWNSNEAGMLVLSQQVKNKTRIVVQNPSTNLRYLHLRGVKHGKSSLTSGWS